MKTIHTSKILITALLTLPLTVQASQSVARVNAQHIDCKRYTYATTQTERQALHHKGLKGEAELIVRTIEACEQQKIFTPQQTMQRHYENDAEIRAERSESRYNQKAHVAGSRY